MPPRAPEVAQAVYGAWRLAHFDPRGLGHFRKDEVGFWNSFFAAALVAPGYAVLIALHLAEAEVTADGLSVVLIHGLAYVISWLAFPLIAYHLCQAMGREAEWLGFVVALNWSKVIQIAAYLPAALIAATAVLGATMGGLITLVVSVAILVYQWFVTRSALDSSGMTAAGLVGVDLILGLAITAFADGAIG